MCHEEEMNPNVNQRKRNKFEAKEYRKLYSNPWNIPISIIITTITLILMTMIFF